MFYAGGFILLGEQGVKANCRGSLESCWRSAGGSWGRWDHRLRAGAWHDQGLVWGIWLNIVFMLKQNLSSSSLLPVPSYSFTRHLWDGWMDSASTFFAPSHQVFLLMDQFSLSLLSCRCTHLRSFILSLYDRCSSSLIMFAVLHWICSIMPMSVLYWNWWCTGSHYLPVWKLSSHQNTWLYLEEPGWNQSSGCWTCCSV